MLLQAMMSVVILAILGLAILTSTLFTAKVAAKQLVARAMTTELVNGTVDFVNWARSYVLKHGAAASWPTGPTTLPAMPICATTGPCHLFATVAFRVFGGTAESANGPDSATNLNQAVSENRISGAVTVTITNSEGTALGARTRFETLRVLDAAPYAIVTGVRDSVAMAGSALAGQGDTGGYRDGGTVYSVQTPNPEKPWLAKDTSISVTMTCSNSRENNDQRNPFNDNHSPGNGNLAWGVSGGTAFEAPCEPEYQYAPEPTIPPDAIIPVGNSYNIDSFKSSRWSDGSARLNTWPR
jgi:hypothetical protein